MPGRKRALEDFDPNKSDPEDEDYDARISHSKAVRSRNRRSRPPRKRNRTTRGESASEDISESEPNSDDSFEEVEPVAEAVELYPNSGRPARKASKKQPQYHESDTDEEDLMDKIDSSGEEGQPSKKRRNLSPKKPLIVTLKLPQSVSAQRTIKATGRGAGSKQPQTSEPTAITRRSSRIAHDDTEGLFALTNSGNHVEVTRHPTKSPETFPTQGKRGSKGLKKLPSAISEGAEESSAQTKKESDREQRSYEAETEVAASGEELLETEEKVGSANNNNTIDVAQQASEGEANDGDVVVDESAVVPESNDEEDDDIAIKPRRSARNRDGEESDEKHEVNGSSPEGFNRRHSGKNLRSAMHSQTARTMRSSRKRGIDDTSDFEPGADEGVGDDMSSSSGAATSPQKGSQDPDDSSSNARRSKRIKTGGRNTPSADHDSEEVEELREELEELRGSPRPRRRAQRPSSVDERPQTRKRKPVDYRIMRPDLNINMEEDAPPPAATPSRRGRGGGAGAWQRSLFSIEGPFGGAGGPPPVLGGPAGAGATGGVDSDSSDDEAVLRQRPHAVGGTHGMTPTTGAPPGFGVFPAAQTHSADALQTSLGKIKDKQALADSDPLGVDPNVNFDGVGGLDGHIDQLKEMVALPLLYPEVFQRFRVTPPRGVLFHGPPGTGKTLLARALASSVSSAGKKVSFYMRKGADALSKWVGEAERQLRLLFEEARKTQPSIIFFDEIDGLAPVRSSKQEQIHASIVSTLLALMDGMDGRGQVIVIGATNRPDSVDPALRRPGRFDREFYFPLPNRDARRKILDIHTRHWTPPVPESLKDELAELTKGYGGADLRALCTEAALNAVQRRYPQIYASDEKLMIKPETIRIAAKDFMISVKRIVPSSERSASSGSSPLPKSVEPLLSQQLLEIEKLLHDVLPQQKRLTALEEAKFEDAVRDEGMRKEQILQEFERSRVFRPRLLLRGPPGMGQQYVSRALLHRFEGLHVQSFDLPTLLSDSTRSPEATIVQLFAEAKRHKPSVIHIPDFDAWYRTVGSAVISTFLGLLKSLSPSEPVLLLGVLEIDESLLDPQMVKDFFGFSKRNQFELRKPSQESRRSFFSPLVEYLVTSPEDFPDPLNRKRRTLEKLDPVPVVPAKQTQALSKEQQRTQKKKDRHTLNVLKVRIQPIMEQIKLKYKKFRTGVVDESAIRYLFEEDDPSIVTSDLPHEVRGQAMFRPYEKSADEHGEPGLRESASGKFFYNLEIVTIEKRLANGYYKRPKDFLSDIKKLTKDSRAIGDTERLLKAQELQANVEVDITTIELETPAFAAECEALYQREMRRSSEGIRSPDEEVQNRNSRGVQTVAGTSAPLASADAHTGGQSNGISNDQGGSNRDSLHSSLTNGISDLSNLQGHRGNGNSNSTSNPSKTEDVQMTNSDDTSPAHGTQNSSFGPSAQARPFYFRTGGPTSLQQRVSFPGSLSQRGPITPLAEGSNPNMYENSASTTSSDKRLTGSSGPFTTPSTRERLESQSMLGRVDPSGGSSDRIEEGPDISMLLDPPVPNSQLPDTQELPQSQASVPNSSQSQFQSQSAQQPPVPLFPKPQTSLIHSLLNDEPSHAPLNVDRSLARQFLEKLVGATSACNIEQLEQIYSGLMAEIWKTRGNWNRNAVVEKVQTVFAELLSDMENCQDFGPRSVDTSYQI